MYGGGVQMTYGVMGQCLWSHAGFVTDMWQKYRTESEDHSTRIHSPRS